MKTIRPPYVPGDIVRHTGRFLRNTGQQVGAPINGEVRGIGAKRMADNQVLDVAWSDGHQCRILACNVEFCPLGKAVTRERRARGEWIA